MNVRQVLVGKGSVVVESVTGASTLSEAIGRLAEKRIGALVVSNSEVELVGIFSERDLVRALASEGESCLQKPVSEYMTHDVLCAELDDSIDKVLGIMTEGRFRHMPVMEDGKLAGVISIGDAVKARIEGLERETQLSPTGSRAVESPAFRPKTSGIRAMERIGLYPGTFDPVTNGHLDVIRRARRLVDRLVVGVAVNPEKRTLFTPEDRAGILRAALDEQELGQGIEVKVFDILLMRFAEQIGAGILIRGLRAVSDFEYEFQMVGMNRAINQEIQTVFLMADANHQVIASKLVKEIARLGGDVSRFVPQEAARRLEEHFSAKVS